MYPDFLALPASDRYVLRNAALPKSVTKGTDLPSTEGLMLADVVISGGKIEAILAPGSAEPDLAGADMDKGQLWPCFVDMHTHLDKGHIWPRRPNPDGSFDGALYAVLDDRESSWAKHDVAARMEFSLKSAYAHGTKAIRTHLDSNAPQHNISWPVFAEMRAKWAGRIDLQAVALFTFEEIENACYFGELVAHAKANDGLLGGFPRLDPNLDHNLDVLFRAAAENGLDVDLHVDESEDPGFRTLERIADAVLRNGFEGKVTAGHCCSLALQDEADEKMIIDKVAKAGISVVSLPMCNMYLQDRHADRTPRWRGVTLVHELMAAGVLTAISSDNTRDPFYAYGDLDGAEVFREGVRIAHLDHPIDQAPKMITATPASILGLEDAGVIAVGQSADLVAFSARSWTELLARPQADRVVIRNGKAIARKLPDYRELDGLME